MNDHTPAQRLDHALNAEEYEVAVHHLAEQLRDEGMSQVDLYLLYEVAFVACEDDNPRSDVLADTMDRIAGGSWANGRDLYPDELIEENIEIGRRKPRAEEG